MFELKNVSKKYGDAFALHQVSLTTAKGLNFIVGASGSGKTTLLKIISGMDQDFEGEVTFGGKDIKKLTSFDKSSFYNGVFGFVWQDFNLLEDSTVLENVLLPLSLKDGVNHKSAEKLLKDMKLQDLAGQKVKYLSGGQKQRVAIARELIKNPRVIIADEPTSALDARTAKAAMEVLRAISKTRTVIVVTHDTTLIQDRDTVFELDKGELVRDGVCETPPPRFTRPPAFHKLPMANAFALAKRNIKNKFGRYAAAVLSLLIAGVLLMTAFSGAVGRAGDTEFKKLLDTYGENILDINIVNSFMSAGGTDGSKKDEPNADVTQNISGLYEKYAKDERVTFALFLQPFNEIQITAGGKKYAIENTGSSPEIKKLLSGNMPVSGNEIVVPESFAVQVGQDKDSILGTEIEFEGSIYNWDSGSPVLKKTKITAKIVGVADTKVSTEFEGKKTEYTLTDAFFFSKEAIENLRNQAGIKKNELNFLMRAKTPNDLIALKNEINQQGIVPLGRFELVEDIVKLSTQTGALSGSAGAIISVLSGIMVIAVFLITGLMRRREYAIYKASGFHNRHLCVLTFVELSLCGAAAMVLLLILSPLLNLATGKFFGADILNLTMLLTGMGLILLSAAVAYIATMMTYIKTDIAAALQSGDRS